VSVGYKHWQKDVQPGRGFDGYDRSIAHKQAFHADLLFHHYCRFTVAKWLTHSPATLYVTGSRPNSGDLSDIYFLESIQSPARRDVKWSV